ncbi:MAG: C69 family dipeptidase [Acidobacteriota bacterium]
MFRKISLTLFLIFILFYPGISDQPWDEDRADSCTSIMVGRLATDDGSVITSHTCDANYRTWLNIVPAKKYKKREKTKIYKGTMHTGFSTDSTGLEVLGEIPQAKETYKFFNTAYPAMNEFQLGMGESTFGGKKELKSDKGIFQIEELQRVALERCKTARGAIKLIGDLIKKYGYCDSGECITISDKKEVWHMEIVGPGKDKFGGIWAAVRIPDGHVGVAANISRIGEIKFNDPDNFLHSKNVVKQAVKLKLYDSKKDGKFKFWKVYGNSYTKKPFSIREYWVFNTLAPSLKLKFDVDELPFSVKPDKKVSLNDVVQLFKATYVGTEYDMTKKLLVKKPKKRKKGKEKKKEKVKEEKPEMIKSTIATPWMSRDMRTLFNTLKKDSVKRYRPIAVEYCAYHTVIQARDWLPDPIGGVLWIGFDNPAITPKFPIHAGVTILNQELSVGSQRKFTLDSAAWAFRRASKLAQGRWDKTEKIINKTLKHYEDKIYKDTKDIEVKAMEMNIKEPGKLKELLTGFSGDTCRLLTKKYLELGNDFWMYYRFRMR